MNNCLRCDHKWNPHSETQHSKYCPKCKSPYWDTPRIEKIYYDHTIHGESRQKLLDYVQHLHGGNITSAAYHLGVGYPTLNKIIKHFKVVPTTIINKIDSATQTATCKKLDAKSISKSLDAESEIIIPPYAVRNTGSDCVTAISPNEHRAQCIAFRKAVGNDHVDFRKKHGLSPTDLKRIYSGEDRVPTWLLKTI